MKIVQQKNLAKARRVLKQKRCAEERRNCYKSNKALLHLFIGMLLAGIMSNLTMNNISPYIMYLVIHGLFMALYYTGKI